MALPTPGASKNDWGAQLNDFLRESHNEDGSLKEESISGAGYPTAEEVAATASMTTQVKSRVIDLSDYVDVTGTTDGTSGLESALADAATAVANNEAPSLYLRAGSILELSGTPEVPDALRDYVSIFSDNVRGAKIVQTTADPAFQTDPNTTPASGTRRRYWRLANLFFEGPGDDVSGSVGLLLNNAYSGRLDNVFVRDFESGVIVDALDLDNGAAAYYNNFHQAMVMFCGIGIHLKNLANANMFFGGMSQGNAIGALIDGAAVGNTLFGMDIESNTEVGLRIRGNRNSVLGGYFENHSVYDIHFDDSGSYVPTRNQVLGTFFGSSSLGIGWDAQKNNVVQVPGQSHLGNQQSNQQYSYQARRVSAKSDQPHYLAVDDFTTGNPIGYQYRTQRRTFRNFYTQYSGDGGTTYYDTWRLGNHPTLNRPTLFASDGTSANGNQIIWAAGDPNGSVTGRVGDMFLRTDGGAGTVFYVKESGNGTNTGWVGK